MLLLYTQFASSLLYVASLVLTLVPLFQLPEVGRLHHTLSSTSFHDPILLNNDELSLLIQQTLSLILKLLPSFKLYLLKNGSLSFFTYYRHNLTPLISTSYTALLIQSYNFPFQRKLPREYEYHAF